MKRIKSITMIVLANVLFALSVQLFLTPSGLITGGSTGIALFVNRMTGIPTSYVSFVFNGIMLLLGLLAFGKQFALDTLLCTIAFPVILNVFEHTLNGVVLTGNLMLNTIYSGVCMGLYIGIVIREGASTGGMDIPPLLLKKYFHLNVSVTMYVMDVLILLLQTTQAGSEMILYGILNVFISTVTLDRILLMGTTRTEVKVISEHSDEIRKAILSSMDRGVTLLNGQGGYSLEDTNIVLTVINNRELPRLEKIIHETDPDSFMTITRVSEVRGRGFTEEKQYGISKGA